jgi:hypothetical protein
VDARTDRGWWARSVSWLVPLLALALFAAFGVLAYRVFDYLESSVKSDDACREVLVRAKAHPAVHAALGSPVEDGRFATGTLTLSGTTGAVNMRFPLSGPKGSAELFVVGSRSGGVWSYSRIVVQVEGTGERIDLQAGIPAEAIPGPGR